MHGSAFVDHRVIQEPILRVSTQQVLRGAGCIGLPDATDVVV